ncbi:R body protein RebB-like protein [Xanthomonas axonopodis]|uniref:R body protein RebB-like protein n=1 Tax=Xanthomonas axonopodis TaxID=53413 RepID=A0A0P6VDI8_9XANT|nr:RebB family R body protein [Xanthomonas axonopodis]KPL50005.1 R body protein RebB-like protein [Xanthomonas axonopodis]
MAFPTSLDSQITEAVTQTNVKVDGEAPAVAMGSIYQSLAHSSGILFQSAVRAQQQPNSLAQAGENRGVMQTYGVDTGACAADVEKVAQGGAADNLNSLLTVRNSFDTAK